jgi:hypothetical protein
MEKYNFSLDENVAFFWKVSRDAMNLKAMKGKVK